VAVELARYVEWFLTSTHAKADAQNNFMVPVSTVVVNGIRTTVLERMTCNGQLLMDLVRHQKYEEEESLKTWKLPILIVTPLIIVVILILIVYAIRQRVQYLRLLDRDGWRINFFDIDFVAPKNCHRRAGNSADTDEDLTPSSNNLVGRWNIHEVVTRPLSIARVFDVNRKVKQTLIFMREQVGHENVSRFFGISSINDAVYLVEQNCANGTLVDFLRAADSKYSLNHSFRYVVCADIANGMAYLHRQNLIHGNLSIDKCHVDSRWTIKIVDWEYTALYDVVRRTNRSQMQATRESVLRFLCGEIHADGSTGSPTFGHLAPEIRNNGLLSEPTRAGDVYSFGVIIRDLFAHSPCQELHQIDNMPIKARQFMGLACREDSIKRPSFEQLEKSIRSAISGRQMNLLDRYVYIRKTLTYRLSTFTRQ